MNYVFGCASVCVRTKMHLQFFNNKFQSDDAAIGVNKIGCTLNKRKKHALLNMISITNDEVEVKGYISYTNTFS